MPEKNIEKGHVLNPEMTLLVLGHKRSEKVMINRFRYGRFRDGKRFGSANEEKPEIPESISGKSQISIMWNGQFALN